ncbi:MAG: YgjV family protein [Firmicutes bacterium]|nr:YgjV family protein [Bacillota bacterium]
MILEIVGYIGSALVVISMLMSSIVKLRVINTIGSIISGVYAVLCGALPLALMNACLITINLINLWKLSRKKQEIFEMVPTDSGNILVKKFLGSYQQDIQQYFPDYSSADVADHTAYIVLKEGAPVGALLGDVSEDALDIVIDYSTPAYRDCSVGAFLYGQLPQAGIHTLRFGKTVAEGHAGYLKKMGYQQKDSQWVLKL